MNIKRENIHDTIQAMLFFPCIILYSAVVVYFLKDIDRNNQEAMRYFFSVISKSCLLFFLLILLTGKIRNFIYDKISVNKPGDWNMNENIYLRLMNYIISICGCFSSGAFVWLFISLGSGLKNL